MRQEAVARASTELGSGVVGCYWGRVRLPKPVSIGIRHRGLGAWLLLKRSSEYNLLLIPLARDWS